MTYSLVGVAPGSDATLAFAGHYSLFNMIKHFASGQLSQDSFSGIGNGKLKRLAMMNTTAPEEVWTLTCTVATADAGTFSVVGSVSGAQADAEVGTLYDNNIIQLLIDDGSVDFAVSDVFILSSTNGVRTLYQGNYAGAGNGLITHMALLDKITETWTLTCTASAVDGGTFSVVGSTSGAQADATVGTFYDNGIIQLLVNDDTTDFAVNDVFTLEAIAQELPVADRWTVQRWDDTADEYELIMEGPGIPGIGETYVGFKTKQSVAGDYFNLVFAVMEAYVSSNTFETQPKFTDKTMLCWQHDIPYWLRITARQIMVGTKVETNYDIGGCGLYNAYYDPGQYPYPSFCGAAVDGQSTARYSETSRQFGVLGNSSRLQVHWIDGAFKSPETLPYGAGFWSRTLEPTGTMEETNYVGTGDGVISGLIQGDGRPDESWAIVATSATNFTVTGSISGPQVDATVGTPYDNGLVGFLITAGATPFVAGDEFTIDTGVQYSLEKIVLTDGNQNYGELEGVHFIAGFSNAVENTVDDDIGDTHIVLRNIFRTGFLDYATLRLD